MASESEKDSESQIQSRKPPVWNSLEILKLLTGVLTPAAIAIVTISTTLAIDGWHKQNEDTQHQRDARERDESRDHDIIKTFTERLQQGEICKWPKIAERLISAATQEKAKILSADYIDRCELSGPALTAAEIDLN